MITQQTKNGSMYFFQRNTINCLATMPDHAHAISENHEYLSCFAQNVQRSPGRAMLPKRARLQKGARRSAIKKAKNCKKWVDVCPAPGMLQALGQQHPS